MKRNQWKSWVLISSYLLLLVGGVVTAQSQPVTDNDVNAVAKKIYCPVCENITLDTCGTSACQDWRDEIRVQLEAGMSEQAVIDDFVQRFGDRVVGTPQDPTLRALTLVMPWVIIGLVLLVVVWMIRYWFRNQSRDIDSAIAANITSDNYYRDLLEKDVNGYSIERGE